MRELPIPAPFDERRFCALYGRQRGRRIALRPWPLRAESRQAVLDGLVAEEPDQDVLYGFVAAERDQDVIYFERDARRLHQQQIVAHEASHLILGHAGSGLSRRDLERKARRLSPGATIWHVYARNGRRTREEYEAELLGQLILLHASSAGARLAASEPQAAELLEFLEGTEGRDG